MPYRILLLASLLLPLDPFQSVEWDALWEKGQRSQGIERLLREVQSPGAPAVLRAQLVSWQLQTSRFEAALQHSEGLAAKDLGLRGRALYFLTRYEESLSHLRLDNPTELLMRVEALGALGRAQQQDSLLPKLREAFGEGSAEVQLVEARSAQRRKDYATAAKIYASVRQQEPLNAEALFGLGQCLIRIKRREQAKALLEEHRRLIPLLDKLDFAQRGVAIAPRSASNQAALGQAWQALIPMDPKVQQKAGGAFALATRWATPQDCVPIALRHGRFHWEVRQDVQAATDVLSAAFEKSQDVRLLVRKADYYEQAKRLDEALSTLQRAARLRPKDKAIQSRIARIKAR